MKEQDPNKIIRFDGKNVFVEVMKSSFNIGKVQINFIEYNLQLEKKKRQTKNISLYIDIKEADKLCTKIISGRLNREAIEKKNEQKNKGYKYCSPIYINMGGISAKTLAQRGKSRNDGKSLSRQFKITPGDKMPWILSGEFGAGEEMENGLIKPAYVAPPGQKFGLPEGIVRVPLTEDDLLMFAITLDKEIQAYYIKQALTNNNSNKNNRQDVATEFIKIFDPQGTLTLNSLINKNKDEILKILYPYIKQAYSHQNKNTK